MKTNAFRSSRAKLWLIILCAILLICGIAAFCSTLPKNETQRKVWTYAKENGLSYWSYPKSLVQLLERNPETEQFVLEYPKASKETVSIDLTQEIQGAAVPLFLQWDQRWGYMQYGNDFAAITACGPVCLSMAAVYLTGDSSYSPDAMIQFASDNGYYVPGSGSSWTLISEGSKKLGFQVTELPLDENRICKALDSGMPVICVVGPGAFTTTGHFLVIVGYEDGKFRIHDPNSISNSQRLWAYEDIKDQIRNLWSISR